MRAAETVAPAPDRRAEPGKADASEESAGQKPALPTEVDSVPLQDGMAPLWPDEAAESAILSELRSRGETAAPAPAEAVEEKEIDPKSLPPLDSLVQRIPAEVRETLDDLFRANFVRVVRVPKKALKE